ncbi:MAG: hypothetical protein K2X08_00880, partial [Chlamydiales bacterium]|nr:hypothetical protein [Chlamydiales bacterium]
DQIKTEFVFCEGKKIGEHNWYDEIGQLLRIMHFTDDQLNGESKAWYPDGALHFVQNYSMDKPVGRHIEYYPKTDISQQEEDRISKLLYYDEKGQFHGEEKSYYQNGTLQSLVCYSHGVLHGLKQLLDEKGVLLEEASYSEGKMEGRFFQRLPDLREVVFHYHNNLKQGLHEVYYPPNEKGEKVKALRAYFDKDRMHGLAVEYNQHGVKMLETSYVSGVKEGLETMYSPEGSLLASMEFVNGEEHGLLTQYFPSGAIFRQTPYVHGKRQGEERSFFEDGTLASACQYEADKLHGLSQTWSQDQILLFEAEYVDGMRHGIFNKYYEDGSPYIQQMFVYDQLEGTKYKYDPSGEVTISEYEEGRLVR